MKIELIFLNKKHTDSLYEQTKTKPQETLEIKRNKQAESYSFNPPKNLFEEGKWLLAVTSFEATNSVFNITNENNSFSSSTPGHWSPRDGEKFVNNIKKLLEIRSENDFELHVKGVEKRGTRKEIENSGYNLARFNHFKIKILSESKRIKYRDLEDVVYRLELTYDKFADILDAIILLD